MRKGRCEKRSRGEGERGEEESEPGGGKEDVRKVEEREKS